jgi:hypothetical protein
MTKRTKEAVRRIIRERRWKEWDRHNELKELRKAAKKEEFLDLKVL